MRAADGVQVFGIGEIIAAIRWAAAQGYDGAVLAGQINPLSLFRARFDEEVKAWLSTFCNGDAADPEFQRRIIDVLVNAVYLYDDKVVIYFNVRDGKQISYTEMKSTVDSAKRDSVRGSIIEPHCPPLTKAGSIVKILPAFVI